MIIPVYVGTEPNQWLPTQVLKHSILTRTKRNVEFIMLEGLSLPAMPMQTGFSFYRWAVPLVNEFRERAIYLDADICVLSDIGDLYEIHMDTAAIARQAPNRRDGYFTSVMVLDCDRLRHWDASGWALRAAADPGFYERLMWVRSDADPAFCAPHHRDFTPLISSWNDLDVVRDDTRLVHYTDLRRQPWRHAKHPCAKTFREELVATIADGLITAADLEREIRLRHVREDLLLQL